MAVRGWNEELIVLRSRAPDRTWWLPVREPSICVLTCRARATQRPLPD